MRRPLVALGLLALLVATPRHGGAGAGGVPPPPGTPPPARAPPPRPPAPAERPEGARARAETVLARSAFAQRVTDIRFPSREAVYRFLLDPPDFAASAPPA